jgi:hypothetical protein
MSMMTSHPREVIFAFPPITGKTASQTGDLGGTSMLNQLKEEELVKMPLHLQIVSLLEYWGKGDEVVTAGFDQIAV